MIPNFLPWKIIPSKVYTSIVNCQYDKRHLIYKQKNKQSRVKDQQFNSWLRFNTSYDTETNPSTSGRCITFWIASGSYLLCTQLRFFDALRGGGGIWGKVQWKIVNKYKLKIGLIMHIILILPSAIPRSFDKHITQSKMLSSCKAYCNDHNILQFYQH